jgi:L-serine kinase (ADP)
LVSGRFALVPVRELKTHEEAEPDRVKRVMKQMQSTGLVRKAIVVDSKSKVVLDGVHRLGALQALGAVRIPVWLVNYSDDEVLVFSKDRRSQIPKDDVLRAATQGPKFPPKTTRHMAKTNDGRLVPLSELESEIAIPLSTLLQSG